LIYLSTNKKQTGLTVSSTTLCVPKYCCRSFVWYKSGSLFNHDS